jgi:hypothetical protein
MLDEESDNKNLSSGFVAAAPGGRGEDTSSRPTFGIHLDIPYKEDQPKRCVKGLPLSAIVKGRFVGEYSTASSGRPKA